MAARVGQRQESKGHREVARLAGRIKALKAEIPWADAARNKAARLRWDQTVERVRNPEGGRCRWGKPAQRSPGLISPEGTEPHGRCHRDPARVALPLLRRRQREAGSSVALSACPLPSGTRTRRPSTSSVSSDPEQVDNAERQRLRPAVIGSRSNAASATRERHRWGDPPLRWSALLDTSGLSPPRWAELATGHWRFLRCSLPPRRSRHPRSLVPRPCFGFAVDEDLASQGLGPTKRRLSAPTSRVRTALESNAQLGAGFGPHRVRDHDGRPGSTLDPLARSSDRTRRVSRRIRRPTLGPVAKGLRPRAGLRRGVPPSGGIPDGPRHVPARYDGVLPRAPRPNAAPGSSMANHCGVDSAVGPKCRRLSSWPMFASRRRTTRRPENLTAASRITLGRTAKRESPTNTALRSPGRLQNTG